MIRVVSVAPIRKKVKPRRAYHHGDLRAALLAAAATIVTEEGVEALTMRECARRAGVSHAAPLHHFGSRAGLIEEFAADGFEGLGRAMDDAAHDAKGQPLLAAGLAYIGYAAAHPERFRLMSKIAAGSARSPRLREASLATRHRLEDALREAYAKRHGRPPSPATLAKKAALAWCCVHGYASLRADGFASDDEIPEPATLLAALRPALLAEE